MIGFFKWVGIVLLVLAIPLVIALGLLLTKPTTSLTWLLRTTADMEYVAANTAIGVWPIALDLSDAQIKPVGGPTLLQLDNGSLRFHLWRFLTGAPSVWSLQADNVTVTLPEADSESLAAEQSSGEAPTQEVGRALDLALPLAFSQLAINSLTIKQAEAEAVSLSFSLERQANFGGADPADAAPLDSVATKITLHQPGSEDFSVAGTLRYRLGATNQLELLIPVLNLNPLLAGAEPSGVVPTSEISEAAEPMAMTSDSEVEVPMDWSWLPSLGNLNLVLKVDELQAAEHQLHGFSGELTADSKSLRLSDLSGRYQMQDEELKTIVEQAFTGDLLLTPHTSQTQGADAKIELKVSGDHFTVGVQGAANLNALAGNDLLLDLKVSDFQIAGDLLNKDFAPLTPFAFAGQLVAAENSLTLNDLQIGAGTNDVQGMLSLSLAAGDNPGLGGLAGVSAKLTSSKLTLQPLADVVPTTVETVEASDAVTEGAGVEPIVTTKGPVKLFSTTPLPLEPLRDFVADVSLTAEQLTILAAEFSEFSLSATSTDDILRVEPRAKFGGGGFGGFFSLDPSADSADLMVEFKLEGIELEAFELVSKDELTGGKTDLELNILSNGASPAALAANSKGLLLLTVVDAVVQNDTFELAGSDLIMEALSKLNPFGKTDPTTQLSCALVKFEGEAGVWKTNNQLVVETEKMEIIGTGKIDFNDETLDIGITPSAKGGVGVNVGSLVKFLKMGGPLSAPRPQADAAGLLKSGLAIGAAASTGGLSILADGLAKRVLNAGDACVKARKPATKTSG